MSNSVKFTFIDITEKQLENLTAFCIEQKLSYTVRDSNKTGIYDVTHTEIHVGDTVGYDFPDDTSSFTVVYEEYAYRKHYKRWNINECPERPLLGNQNVANNMRYKIIKKNGTINNS